MLSGLIGTLVPLEFTSTYKKNCFHQTTPIQRAPPSIGFPLSKGAWTQQRTCSWHSIRFGNGGAQAGIKDLASRYWIWMHKKRRYRGVFKFGGFWIMWGWIPMEEWINKEAQWPLDLEVWWFLLIFLGIWSICLISSVHFNCNIV